MNTDRELMQQALELIEDARNGSQRKPSELVITALRERLAQPVQEPVAWLRVIDGKLAVADGGNFGDDWTPLYTAPPQRKSLPPQSPCEMTQAERKMFRLGWLECEAAHGIGEKPDAA